MITEKLSAVDEMKLLMERLISAAEHLDADGFMALCRPSAEFLAVTDGVISGYDQFAAATRSDFGALKRHKLTFDTLLYRALGVDAAAALGLFHQLVTDGNGSDSTFQVECTWIATRSGGGPWLLTYGHVCHRPD